MLQSRSASLLLLLLPCNYLLTANEVSVCVCFGYFGPGEGAGRAPVASQNKYVQQDGRLSWPLDVIGVNGRVHVYDDEKAILEFTQVG